MTKKQKAQNTPKGRKSLYKYCVMVGEALSRRDIKKNIVELQKEYSTFYFPHKFITLGKHTRGRTLINESRKATGYRDSRTQ